MGMGAAGQVRHPPNPGRKKYKAGQLMHSDVTRAGTSWHITVTPLCENEVRGPASPAVEMPLYLSCCSLEIRNRKH